MSRHGEDSLIIGRFQPLHKGHMDVIRKVASESRKTTIGIGSAQYSHTEQNPFTAGERYRMIAETLVEEGFTDFYVVPVEDINRYSLWVAQVVSICPHFTMVYSNNPYTRRLFAEAGYEVRDSPLYNREIYSGTEVRRRILEGEDWESLVPPAVARVIGEIDGVGRIRELVGEPVNGP
ncbi:MAG: nicotinamide-nucleotide adenylyltransferase [Thermoplasmatales archaeon]|nr:nicotinamide-nucleotide adenylyltransferase [Thermoplasmatales archaeon]